MVPQLVDEIPVEILGETWGGGGEDRRNRRRRTIWPYAPRRPQRVLHSSEVGGVQDDRHPEDAKEEFSELIIKHGPCSPVIQFMHEHRNEGCSCVTPFDSLNFKSTPPTLNCSAPGGTT